MIREANSIGNAWQYHRGAQVRPVPGRAAMKERYNQLAGLNADRVKYLYEAWRKGDYADLQIAFAELEEYDDILSSVADKRDAAIGEATYSVRPIAAMIGDNAALAAQAEQQQAWLTRKLSTILNLKEAIRWLGTASFRGYAHLYIEQSGGNVRLLPVPQWYFADPAGEGVFYLNPTAAAGAGDLYELPPGQYIVRTVKRPVDIIALGACVIKYNGEQGWQSFLDIFGNPAIFFEYPPGTSDDRAREYDAMAKALIGDGRGGFPSGGKFTTIDTQAKGGESFQQITDWANKKIVRKALAGELTLLAESGTGTLAGGAHAEGFKSLATGDCRSIAECIQSQYLDRLLDRKYPGMPHLVEFILEYPETRDVSIETAAIATLAGAGFVADAEQVAERTGYNCTYQQPQQGMPNGMPAMLANRAPGNAGGVEEAPLTAEELEAFQSLAKPNRERMGQRQKEVETALRRAADLPLTIDNLQLTNEGNGAAAPRGELGNREYKRDSNGRFASTGAAAHSHKGGRGSQGNPKAATTKSNTPLKAAPGAKKQAQVDATEHALKATARKGKVEGAAHVSGKPLDIDSGHPDYYGTQHAARHFKPGDTDERKTAKALVLGEREKDEDGVVSFHRDTRAVVKTDKKGKEKMVTAYKDRSKK